MVVETDQLQSPEDENKSGPLEVQTAEFDKVRQFSGIGEHDEVRPHDLQPRHLDKSRQFMNIGESDEAGLHDLKLRHRDKALLAPS